MPHNTAVERDGHKLRLWFPPLCSGRPSLPRKATVQAISSLHWTVIRGPRTSLQLLIAEIYTLSCSGFKLPKRPKHVRRKLPS